MGAVAFKGVCLIQFGPRGEPAHIVEVGLSRRRCEIQSPVRCRVHIRVVFEVDLFGKIHLVERLTPLHEIVDSQGSFNIATIHRLPALSREYF